MSAAPPAKKAAISSFFNKSKAKKGAGGGSASDAGHHVDSIIKNSDLGLPGVSDSAAWDDAPVDGDGGNDSGLASIASKFSLGVAELEPTSDELDDDDKIRRSLEAQEARRALAAARAHAREKAAATTAAAPAPAPSSAPVDTKWRPRSLLDKAEPASSSNNKEPNIKDERAFPTLGRAMSGIHPGAKLVEKDKGLVSLASKNPWADLAGMEDEEDDMDQEEQKRAQEAAAAAAPAAKAGAAAPAAAAGPDLEGPAADGLLRPPTTAKVCNTDKEVKEEVEKICAELRTSKDYAEAIRRLAEEVGFPQGRLIHMRTIAAECVALFALDCTTTLERMTVGRLLPLLIPAKMVSRAMFSIAIGRVNARLDVPTWASDYPKAKEWLVSILESGAIVGGRLFHPADGTGAAGGAAKGASSIPPHDQQAVRDQGYAPLTSVHPKVVAAMKLATPPVTASMLKEAGRDLAPISKTLRKEYGDEDEEDEKIAGGAAGTVAPSDALGADRERAAAAAKDSGLDEEGPSVVGKKKKKKKAAKGDDDDEDAPDVDAI